MGEPSGGATAAMGDAEAAAPAERPHVGGQIRVTVSMLSGEELLCEDLSPGLTILELKKRMQALIGWPHSGIQLSYGAELLQPDKAELGTLVGHASTAHILLAKRAIRGQFHNHWWGGWDGSRYKDWRVAIYGDDGQF